MTSLGPILRTLEYLPASQIAALLLNRATAPWYRSWFYGALFLRPRAGGGLRRSPPWPWPGDSENGQRILDGGIRLLNREASFGDHPDWTATDQPLLWRFALHYFDWLDDLVATDKAEAPARARALIAHWIAARSRPEGVAWHPYPTSLRVYAWLARAPFLLGGANDDFRKAFVTSLDRQVRHLARREESHIGGNHRIKNLKALIAAGLCLEGQEARVAPALASLRHEVARQVLPDGCHYERSPAYHLQVLRDLIDVRDLIAETGDVPAWLTETLGRMGLALAFLRHGDGGLALFNDGDVGEAAILAATTARLETTFDMPPALADGGYQCLAYGRTLVLFDTGLCCPDDLPAHAHADTLSFELSDGPHRIVVNCGTYAYQDATWRHRLRATAAHSTIQVDGEDSAEVYGLFRLGRRPRQVRANGSSGAGGKTIIGRHDGYRRHGVIHRRRLKLAPDGNLLSGEDSLEPVDASAGSSHALTARFHLHPEVSARIDYDGSIHLGLADGTLWRFESKTVRPRLEPSIYAPHFYEMQETQQIVLQLSSAGFDTRLAWRFGRLPG